MKVTPAVVELRVPGDVVRLPLWRPAYTRHEAKAHIDSLDQWRCTLEDAEEAHAAGNPAAALVAARLLHVRPDQCWPSWLSAAVVAMLEQRDMPRRRGRTGNPWAQWRSDAADYLRYRAVEILRDDRYSTEPPDRRLYVTLADRLSAEGGEHAAAAGDARAMELAYRRVVDRCPRLSNRFSMHYHPRYYPDPVTLHVLHAADVVKQTPELIT